jgi:hypothetical protein
MARPSVMRRQKRAQRIEIIKLIASVLATLVVLWATVWLTYFATL